MVTAQVVFERKGLCPDVTRFSVSVEETIKAMFDKEEYLQIKVKLDNLTAQLDGWTKNVEHWEKQEKLAKEYKEIVSRKDEEIRRLKAGADGMANTASNRMSALMSVDVADRRMSKFLPIDDIGSGKVKSFLLTDNPFCCPLPYSAIFLLT